MDSRYYCWGAIAGPSKLYSDSISKSARDVSYNPEHHDRMKHVERRHFFVRDMVESFELEVPYVPTAENPSDFFTKLMKNATQFNYFRRMIMNEPDSDARAHTAAVAANGLASSRLSSAGGRPL